MIIDLGPSDILTNLTLTKFGNEAEVSLPNEVLIETIIYDYLREIIYLFSRSKSQNGDTFIPVHTKKIVYEINNYLGIVAKIIDAESESRLSPLLSTKWVKKRLKILCLLGDIASVRGGFWLPTPIRFIRFPFGDDVGVVGGLPSRLIDKWFCKVNCYGIGRTVNTKDVPQKLYNMKELWQPYDQWCGSIPSNIVHWTQSKLQRVINEGTKSISTFRYFEIMNITKTKYFWTSFEDGFQEKLKDSVFLCRTKYKPRHYFLGLFNEGKLVKELSLEQVEVEWMPIGFICLYGSGLQINWERHLFRIYPMVPRTLEKELLFFATRLSGPKIEYFSHSADKVFTILNYHGLYEREGK